MPTGVYDRGDPVARFWSKVDQSGAPDSCWPWVGGRTTAGYGSVQWDGGVQYAHRIAWRLTAGPIPASIFVCHRCDNPPCCNPAHLFLGTHADNMVDKVAKGRVARGEASGPRRHPERMAHGATHWRVKLTEADVLAIRERAASCETRRSLATAFGVHESCINKIIRREAWAHVAPSAADDLNTPSLIL